MAVGLTENLLKADGREGEYEVRSAGTWTLEGRPATPLAVEVMAERGIDISSHRSHRLTPQDMEEADLVVVMTQGHKEALTLEFPQAEEKICLLAELAGKSHDIEDPYGSDSIELYRQCADQIEELLREGYGRLTER